MGKNKIKHEVLFSVGSMFRQLRMRKGFTSAEIFSFEHDLNRTAYWRWENGQNITMKNFLKLCDIHSISPKELFGMIEGKKTRVMENSMMNEPNEAIQKKINNETNGY